MSETPSMTAQQIKSKRVVLLLLSTLVLLFIGLIYAFSMFAKPMVADFHLGEGIALTFNIMMITFCIGAIAGSFLDKILGVKASLIVCAIMFAIGFCGTGMLGSQGMWVLYLFYGVIGGFGVGIGYNTIVATTNVWFPDKVGFSSGVMMMGFGVSSLIFGNLSLMVRPMVGGMSSTLIILGIVTAVLVFVLATQLRRPPADIVAVLTPEKLASANGGAELGEGDAILKTPIFYVYYIWGIIVIALGLAVIGNCAADATLLGVDAGFAVLLVGLVSTCNGLARIVIGNLYDRTNVIITMLVDGIVGLIAVACILFAFTTKTPMLYIVGALACGFAYGGVPVIASAFARQRFGAKKYPFNLAITNFSIALGSFVNIIVAAVAGASNRASVFTIILVLALIAVIDVLPFSRMWKREVLERD